MPDTLRTPPSDIQGYINEAAAQYGVDPRLLQSVMQSESNYKANVKDGSKGEIGLMQLLPDTRRTLGLTDEQAHDPRINTFAGAYWLRQKIEKQAGRLDRGVVAYNGTGPDAERYGKNVMALYHGSADQGPEPTVPKGFALEGTTGPSDTGTEDKVPEPSVPKGFELESSTQKQPTQAQTGKAQRQPTAYEMATRAGPYAPAGAAERAIGQEMGGLGPMLKASGQAIASGINAAMPIFSGGASLPAQMALQGGAAGLERGAYGGTPRQIAKSTGIGALIPPASEFGGAMLRNLYKGSWLEELAGLMQKDVPPEIYHRPRTPAWQTQQPPPPAPPPVPSEATASEEYLQQRAAARAARTTPPPKTPRTPPGWQTQTPPEPPQRPVSPTAQESEAYVQQRAAERAQRAAQQTAQPARPPRQPPAWQTQQPPAATPPMPAPTGRSASEEYLQQRAAERVARQMTPEARATRARAALDEIAQQEQPPVKTVIPPRSVGAAAATAPAKSTAPAKGIFPESPVGEGARATRQIKILHPKGAVPSTNRPIIQDDITDFGATGARYDPQSRKAIFLDHSPAKGFKGKWNPREWAGRVFQGYDIDKVQPFRQVSGRAGTDSLRIQFKTAKQAKQAIDALRER